MISELTWNHWTAWEDTPNAPGSAEEPPPRAPERQQTSETERPKGHYVLRPVWQRAAYVAAQIFVGGSIAIILFIGRSRVVRRLFLIPSPKPVVPAPSKTPLPSNARLSDELVVLQTIHTLPNSGQVFPKAKCVLEPGKDHTETMIHVEDVSGKFWLGLTGAKIGGTKMNAWEARDGLLKRWYGEQQARKLKARIEWGGLYEEDKSKSSRKV